MKKVSKAGNNTLYVYIGIAVSLALLWRGGEYVVKEKLAKVEVRRLESKVVTAPVVDVKSFFAVFIKQPAAIKAQHQADGQPIDSLFSKPVEDKPVEVMAAPVEPDYVAQIKQSASLDAISDNGAVINGKFFAIGQPIAEMGYVVGGSKRVEPKITRLGKDNVTLQVDKATVTLKLVPTQV